VKWFVLVLVFLVGCDMVGFGSPQPQVPKITDLLIGTQGIVSSFVSLPQSILMCQNMDVVVEMKNLGASVGEGDYVFIVEEGVLKSEAVKGGRFKVEGKTQYSPQGEVIRKSLKVRSQNLPSQLETLSTPVIFQACYPYKTFLSSQVCLSSLSDGKGACVPKTLTYSGGQGAPVSVTKVEPKMLPEGDGVRPAVILSVANVGGGRIVSASQVSSVCSGASTADRLKNEIVVSAQLGGEEMDCNPKMLPFEVGKDVQVVCTGKNVVRQESYETVLTAELSYGYVSTVSRQITVNRLSGQKDCKI
jgi:hypothetical protein